MKQSKINWNPMWMLLGKDGQFSIRRVGAAIAIIKLLFFTNCETCSEPYLYSLVGLSLALLGLVTWQSTKSAPEPPITGE